MHPHPTLPKISNMFDANQKANLKWFFKKNGHVIFWKYSPQLDLLLFLWIVQIGLCTLPPLKEKAHTPTSNGHGRVVNLNCSFLSPLIRMGKSLTRT